MTAAISPRQRRRQRRRQSQSRQFRRAGHAPKAPPVPCHPGRSLHLVDIENLGVEARGAPISPGVGARYRSVASVSTADQFMVGCDATRIVDAAREFPGASTHPGRGPDGGERVLTQAVDLEWVADRFQVLSIGSGDHWFAPLVIRAKELGLYVVVISRRSRLARGLRSEADHVWEFPETEGGPPEEKDPRGK